jgi:hypothetical protein
VIDVSAMLLKDWTIWVVLAHDFVTDDDGLSTIGAGFAFGDSMAE